jgi:hypothetical protein
MDIDSLECELRDDIKFLTRTPLRQLSKVNVKPLWGLIDCDNLQWFYFYWCAS